MAAQFDGVNLIITLDAPTASVLNQATEQVYDDAKQWHLNANNRKYPFPFLTSGGEDITDVTIAGQYYFLLNNKGWRIISTDESQNVFWDGNLIPNDLSLPIINERPGRTVLHLGLQPLVTGITTLPDIHGQVERSIYIDTSAVINGNGYQQTPYNNFTDAVDDAEESGIRSLMLLADATVDRQLKNFTFRGIGNPTLDGNGQNLDKSEFHDMKLTGSIDPASILHCHFVELLTGLTGLQGNFFNCGFAGTITLATGSTSLFIDCYSLVPGLSRPTVNVNGGVSMVSIRGYKGGLIVGGSTNASNEITVSMSTGRLRLAASNTAGTISCRGICDFDDQSAGATVEISGLVDEVVFNHIMEAGETFAEQVRLLRADAAGDVDEPVDGTYAIRDAADTKNRVEGTQTANGGRNVTLTDGT